MNYMQKSFFRPSFLLKKAKTAIFTSQFAAILYFLVKTSLKIKKLCPHNDLKLFFCHFVIKHDKINFTDKMYAK